MLGYYPGKHATNQTEVLFHCLPPLAQLVLAKSSSKSVPLPATISIHRCAQTNANFSRLFLATEPRSGISGRSWPLGTELLRVDQVMMSLIGPSVWTGRALQAENDDPEMIGLALLYRPVSGTVAFLAIMDIRARSISFASRPRKGHMG